MFQLEFVFPLAMITSVSNIVQECVPDSKHVFISYSFIHF